MADKKVTAKKETVEAKNVEAPKEEEEKEVVIDVVPVVKPKQAEAPKKTNTYTIEKGDTLGVVADKLNIAGGWFALYSANREAIGSSPDNISAGQVLDLP